MKTPMDLASYKAVRKSLLHMALAMAFFLSLGGLAQANSATKAPVLLTEAQMDQVVAGTKSHAHSPKFFVHVKYLKYGKKKIIFSPGKSLKSCNSGKCKTFVINGKGKWPTKWAKKGWDHKEAKDKDFKDKGEYKKFKRHVKKFEKDMAKDRKHAKKETGKFKKDVADHKRKGKHEHKQKAKHEHKQKSKHAVNGHSKNYAKVGL